MGGPIAIKYPLNWVERGSHFSGTKGPWGKLSFLFTPTKVVYKVTLDPALLDDPAFAVYGIHSLYFNVPSKFTQDRIVSVNGHNWPYPAYILKNGTCCFGDFNHSIKLKHDTDPCPDTFELVLGGFWNLQDRAAFLRRATGTGDQSAKRGHFFAIRLATRPSSGFSFFTHAFPPA